MTSRAISRRTFAASLAAAAAHRALPQLPKPSLAHADVAALERDRILAEAKLALAQPIAPLTLAPLTALATPHPGTPRDFYTEPIPPPSNEPRPANPPDRAAATALRIFSNTVATLTAAFLLTKDDTYALHAGRHLYAWFVDPATSMTPNLTLAGCPPGTAKGTPAGMADAAPLAEVARALSFLVDSPALSPPDLDATHAWLAALLDWLNTDRNALIARDTKDHVASTWLLLASAISRTLRDDATLDACRHRFRKPTLRNQINSLGAFPHEAATPFPYRNTLLNFDLLAGACQLLSTPFDDLWPFELEDGPGMRSVAAFLYPFILDRSKWPFVADPQFFRDLPGRRPALLFAGRAFNRPEYVEAWLNTPPNPLSQPEPIAASFPIHEPLLWTARALHGL